MVAGCCEWYFSPGLSCFSSLFVFVVLLWVSYGNSGTLQMLVFLFFSLRHSGHSVGPPRSLSRMLLLFIVIHGLAAWAWPGLHADSWGHLRLTESAFQQLLEVNVRAPAIVRRWPKRLPGGFSRAHTQQAGAPSLSEPPCVGLYSPLFRFSQGHFGL